MLYSCRCSWDRDWDLVQTSKPKPRLNQKVWDGDSRLEIGDRDSRLHNLWILLKYFIKFLSLPLILFFRISGIFGDLFWLFLTTNATNKNLLNYRSCTKLFLCDIPFLKTKGFSQDKRPRPVAFETETRPDIFETETETRKNGSRHHDQLSRLHHCTQVCYGTDLHKAMFEILKKVCINLNINQTKPVFNKVAKLICQKV